MRILFIILIGFLLVTVAYSQSSEDSSKARTADSIKVFSEEEPDSLDLEQTVVYYLHGNRRCATCQKLEAYSEEAVSSGFKQELDDSSVIWKVVNFEDEGNEHFAKDYQLYSQSLIISRIKDGKEINWKNLDKIWKLVGDKDEFITYVQDEIKKFIGKSGE